MIAARAISLAIGYLFGLFQTGYFYSRKRDFDLRSHGSGNTGTTNTIRTMGWKAGVIVFAGDVLKAVLAILIVWLVYRNIFSDSIHVLELYAGAGAILGHDFPFYLKGKGGKGMACTAGLVFGFCPLMVPFEAALFLIPVLITRYVSLGSLFVYAGFPVCMYAFIQFGWLNIPGKDRPEMYIIAILLAVLAFWQHRANIKRLLSGTENKFGSAKK